MQNIIGFDGERGRDEWGSGRESFKDRGWERERERGGTSTLSRMDLKTGCGNTLCDAHVMHYKHIYFVISLYAQFNYSYKHSWIFIMLYNNNHYKEMTHKVGMSGQCLVSLWIYGLIIIQIVSGHVYNVKSSGTCPPGPARTLGDALLHSTSRSSGDVPSPIVECFPQTGNNMVGLLVNFLLFRQTIHQNLLLKTF